MSKGARFALALLLFWIAFACFYVAFHPGGLLIPGADPDADPNADDQSIVVNGAKFHKARNPAEVIKHIVLALSAGVPNTPGGATSNA